MKTVIIVGANFINKGAQSMLFITCDEIKKRYPNCNVYFATVENYDENQFKFRRLYFSSGAKAIAMNDNSLLTRVKLYAKEFAKTILGRGNNLSKLLDLKTILPKTDLIIDVSGFALGDKWPIRDQEIYLDNIRLAKKYSVPIVLMPQSFGPFNYKADESFLVEEIRELLSYPKLIYAREMEGYECLTNFMHLTNVKLSTDLVLQNTGINFNNIFRGHQVLNIPDIEATDSVAVIPNQKCFKHGNEHVIIERYRLIIDELLNKGKKVFILRHASEDADVARKIYSFYDEDSCVEIFDQDFSCIEYDEIVKKFEFIICSRFHGIVHAYRNAIPCVVLGWAIKYTELCTHVDQLKYVFDITTNAQENDHLIYFVDEMISNFKAESEIISLKLKEIQKDNCFQFLDRDTE